MINIVNLFHTRHIFPQDIHKEEAKDKNCSLKKKLRANFKDDILTRHQHSKARLHRTGLDAHAVNLFSG